jgi:hypothetical protein
MLDFLFAVGQGLCLLGLGWGAWLAFWHSEAFALLRATMSRHRTRLDGARRQTAADDPHASSLGYWP